MAEMEGAGGSGEREVVVLKKEAQSLGAAGPSLEGSAWLGSLLTEIERKWRRIRAVQQTEGPRKA